MADDKDTGQQRAGTATADSGAGDSPLDQAVGKARERREESVPFEVVSEKPLPKSSREVVIEVPRSEWDSRLQELFKEVKPTAALEGFRKGKVPMKLLQRRFKGEASSQLVERITPNIVRDYATEKDLTLYGVPTITDYATDGEGPVRITISIEVKPEIEPKDYAGIEVEVPEFKLEEEMVDKRIEELRDQNATLEEVDRELADKDAAVLDLQAVDSKGHTVEQEANRLYDNPHEQLPHEVAHALFGKKAGETAELKVQNEDIGEVRYTVTLKSVKVSKKPELDDEFAKDVGFESLEAMQTSLREQMQKSVDTINKDEAFERLVDKLVAAHDFEVPPALKDHVERDMARQDYTYMSRTGMTPPRLRGLATRTQYQEELDRAAEQRVRGFLLLDAIGKAEKMEAEEADIEAALEERGQQEGRKGVAIRAGLEKRRELTQFTEQVRFNKIREFLLTKTVIKFVEPPKEETPEAVVEGAEQPASTEPS